MTGSHTEHDAIPHLQAAIGSAYAISRELSGGAMARVFVATETALNREVVLKILRPGVASTISVERFRREIAVAARLEHPGIVPVLSAGEAEGYLYYTMPFVDGESLAERLARVGELPIQATLAILKDVIDALAYAHRQGVAHRDIKPANILLTGTRARLTDFGIAKALLTPGVAGTGADRASGLTSMGITLGTPTYMAPEQAAGDPATDQRADIYSLGVVAYEMLTGRPPFEGRPAQAIMAAHATETPESILRRRPSVPAGLADIVTWCLEKRPADRPQNAGELATALEEVSSGPRPVVRQPLTTVIPGSANSGNRVTLSMRRNPWIVGTLALGALLGGVLINDAIRGDGRATVASNAPPVSSFILPPEGEDFVPGTNFAISGDGSRLAFVTRGQAMKTSLWVRATDSLTAMRIADADGATEPFWSPDGRSLGFFADQHLKVVDLTGTDRSVRTLCPAPFPSGGTWGAGDVIVFAPTYQAPLLRVRASGGSCDTLTKIVQGEHGHRRPSFISEKSVLFSDALRRVYTADLSTGKHTLLRDSVSEATFVAPNRMVFLDESQAIFVQELDPRSLKLRGAPRLVARLQPITAGANVSMPFGSYSVSPADIMVLQRIAVASRRLVWVDRHGSVVDSAALPGSASSFAVSHDARSIVFAGESLWIHDRSRGIATVMPLDTTTPVRGRGGAPAPPAPAGEQDYSFVVQPAWSPGDSLIAFYHMRASGVSLDLFHLSGRTERLVSVPAGSGFGTIDWSPDGQTILFTRSTSDSIQRQSVWAYSLVTRSAHQLFGGESNVDQARYSPDGRWIAYIAYQGTQSDVFIRRANGGVPTRVSTSGGANPRWRRDGKELYYAAADGRIMSVAIGASGGELPSLSSASVAVPRPRIQLFSAMSNFDLDASGQQFVGFEVADRQSSLILMMNWLARATRPAR